jgi:hypothetical protein
MNPEPRDISLSECWQNYNAMRQRIASDVMGRLDDAPGSPGTIDLLLLALFADGHVLLEDFPGSGKSFLCDKLGKCIKDDWTEAETPAHPKIQSFKRIQCTPDLLPQDLHSIIREGGAWHPGPIFANVLMVDEINRTGPKVQSGLLQAMAEQRVSIDGVDKHLGDIFFVVATQNPLDQMGTYPLPAASLDRFLFKRTFKPIEGEALVKVMLGLTADNPDPSAVAAFNEWSKYQNGSSIARVEPREAGRADAFRLVKVSQLQDSQRALQKLCEVHPSLVQGLLMLRNKISKIVEEEWSHPEIIPLKPGSTPSPRALQWLVRCIKVLAFVQRGLSLKPGEAYEDRPTVARIELLPQIACDFLRHRLVPRPGGVTAEQLDEFIRKLAKEVVAEVQAGIG